MVEKYRVSVNDVWNEMKQHPLELAIALGFDGYGAASNALWPLEVTDPLTALGQTGYIAARYGKHLGWWTLPVMAVSYLEEATPFLSDMFPATTAAFAFATYRRLKKEQKEE